ncbi:hypothetical protein [Nisaea sp.]|uniref:hypothetical protein n=1 Tax=Nisaea sp. TaxID=2024842 RepID=UPI002B26BC90|nr:hypothetical protein [Nisaea sp.]
MARLSYRKHFIPCAVLFALGACANAEENVLFVTATQIDIGYDAVLGNGNIGYDRNEFVAGPQYVETGGTPPIVSDLDADLSFFSPKINQLYATGNAALLATGGNPEAKIGNANDLKGKRRAMFFGTSTSFGLNLKFQAEVPTAISLGYKRKEMSVIPLNESMGREKDQVDKYGSTLARIEMNGDFSAPLETSVDLRQFFATGKAAEILAPKLRVEIENRATNDAAANTLKNINSVVTCVSPGIGTMTPAQIAGWHALVDDTPNLDNTTQSRFKGSDSAEKVRVNLDRSPGPANAIAAQMRTDTDKYCKGAV